MTNEQFAAYLSDESHLYTVGYEELKTLVMHYPYSANLRLLLLKKSLLEKNKDSDRNLSMAATYVTDRRQLSKTVKKLKNPVKVSENVLLTADFLELTELSNLDKVLAEKTIPHDFTTTQEKEKTLKLDLISIPTTNQPELFSLDLMPLDAVSGSEHDAPNVSDLIVEESPIENIETKPIEEVISILPVSISIPKDTTSLPQPPPDKEPEEDLEKYRAIPVINDNDIELLYASLADKHQNNKKGENQNVNQNESEMPIEFEITNSNKTIIKEPATTEQEASPKISFTSWLQQFRVNEVPVVIQTIENTPTIAETPQKEIIPPIENSESVLELKETIKPTRLSKKAKFDSLAQLFESIESVPDNLFEPTEKKNEDTVNSQITLEDEDDKPLYDHTDEKKNGMHDLAIKSIVLNDDILSETLADIHLKQGNFAKANEMYKRLMLQNPEKSNYFAAKIKQNLLNVSN